MMENQSPTIEEAIEQVTCGCPGCLSVPLSILALEVSPPVGGLDGLLEQLGIKQVTDHIGRKGVSAAGARKLLQVLRRQDELAVEDHARRTADIAAQWRAPVGVPALEGMTPFESMVAAGVVTVTPEQEFGGRPKPRFLQDALAAGERARAEEKRLADEAAKERLAKQAKDRLGGKQ